MLLGVLTVGCAGATTWSEPTSGMTFVRIQAGEFTMGSPEGEQGHQPDERLHRVRLSRDFFLSTHEVTERQWNAVVNPGTASAHPDWPMVNVSWFDVQNFIERLNASGRERFRLPSEAEWEYACRAKTTTPYSVGDRLSTDHANYNGNFPLRGQPAGLNRGALVDAGTFAPNPWGLYDMHGNAWEWTLDDSCGYSGDSVDPVGSCPGAPPDAVRPRGQTGRLKVIRGGSWRFNADSARCALRYTHRREDRGDSLGFRLVREIAE
jgi:formylglycine-generating enzyme required for sulfatase activity